MDPDVLLATLAGTLLVAVLGAWTYAVGSAERRELVAPSTRGRRRGLRQLLAGTPDRLVRRTRLGRRLEQELSKSGLGALLPAEAVALALTLVLAVYLVASAFVARHVAVLLGVAALLGLRALLRWRQERLRAAFVAQMPELARVLASATSAGLSIRAALEIAGDELSEPAGSHLRRLTDSMAVGMPLEEALLDLEARVPGRELSVLVGTLVIASRSGGSLITALRDISMALEDRKELKREIKTLLTQATYTGYLVCGLGVGLLFLINGISPGLLRELTETVVGQAALAFAVACFATGLLVIRRMTRIDL